MRSAAPMVLLYAARLSGLGHRDLAQVECACGRTKFLTAAMLATAGMAAERKVFDLGLRQRCRERDEKGRAVVSISGSNKGVTLMDQGPSLTLLARRRLWPINDGELTVGQLVFHEGYECTSFGAHLSPRRKHRPQQSGQLSFPPGSNGALQRDSGNSRQR